VRIGLDINHANEGAELPRNHILAEGAEGKKRIWKGSEKGERLRAIFRKEVVAWNFRNCR